jgi:hypothetical protein
MIMDDTDGQERDGSVAPFQMAKWSLFQPFLVIPAPDVAQESGRK